MKLSNVVLVQPITIESRIAEMAALIDYDLQDEEIVILAVLNGSYIFTADMTRRLTIPYSLEFVGVKSTDGNRTGKIKELIFFGEQAFEGKHVLLLDDILDTGETLSFLKNDVQKKGAVSVTTCIMVEKEHTELKKKIEADYRGFLLPNKWLIGYGMDYHGKYRGLPYIGFVE